MRSIRNLFVAVVSCMTILSACDNDNIALKKGVCKICGCTANNPCYTPHDGYCWWTDETESICSHCKYDEIKNKYKNKLISGEQDMYLMCYDSTPIGYVQIYKNDDSYEYDLFIGEEDYLHRGIGSRVVKMINDLIYEKYKVDHIVLRPFKRNVGAVNCYKKNGFEIIDEYEDEDTLGNKEIYLLMINKK